MVGYDKVTIYAFGQIRLSNISLDKLLEVSEQVKKLADGQQLLDPETLRGNPVREFISRNIFTYGDSDEPVYFIEDLNKFRERIDHYWFYPKKNTLPETKGEKYRELEKEIK